jgi:hypothetical protein
MVFADTHTVIIHWIWMATFKILDGTLLKCLYFGFGIDSKFWNLVCGIPSEEGRGFPGLLENYVTPHTSITSTDFLCAKSFLKILHSKKRFDPSQCLIYPGLGRILDSIDNPEILLRNDYLCLYFRFGIDSKFWNLACGIPSEEGRGFPGPLENYVTPHTSITLTDFLCAKSFLKILHSKKRFDPSQCLIDPGLGRILNSIDNPEILLRNNYLYLT